MARARPDNRNYSVAIGTQHNAPEGPQGNGRLYHPFMSGVTGVQGHDGEFRPVACTDCGRDNLGTLNTEPDNKPRCIRCHDKFMMIHDIPKCGGCGEPTPFGHKVDKVIHCDICYHNLLANKLVNQVNDLTMDDHVPEPAWDDFENFNSFEDPDRPEMDYGTTDPSIFDTYSKFKKVFRKEPKEVEETHMTPDRLEVLRELQRNRGIPTPHGMNSPAHRDSLNAAQRMLMDNSRGFVTEEELEKKREKVLNYDFGDSPKASKTRKPIKDTKVGGWFSNLIKNVKEGWAEMMEEGKEEEAAPEEKSEVVETTPESVEEKIETPVEKKEAEDDRRETKSDNA